jgi:hypothetical protein
MTSQSLSHAQGGLHRVDTKHPEHAGHDRRAAQTHNPKECGESNLIHAVCRVG